MNRHRPAERLVWAVDTMNIQPDHRVLEIGCGHGVAVSLVCEKLETGKIVAIDRSLKMIEMARKRNADHIDIGTASFQTVSLHEADLVEGWFDKIFAFNVGVFWRQQSALEFELIKSCIAPYGELYLFFQSINLQTQPSPGSLPEILQSNGFTVKKILMEDLATARVGCVIAEKSLT
ncbi:class I SAM-dependent methyltransferase [Bacillus sp. IITD106]|nr:class I SAM-dependent methyltransferase [Bacillus sp. IITD106]